MVQSNKLLLSNTVYKLCRVKYVICCLTLFQKLDNAIAELLDTSEPLIHNIYGYGSQGLINLMLTGQAVPHVWDHDKDVGGLSMPILAIASVLTKLIEENMNGN